ncbi:MAG: nucleotidyltransferase domain-containing protein [Bacteroidetes bacterium]|nr:MAG: nucleotidyltransferase domain-containing protein [Bacteroidota bacterium]
MGIGTIQQEQLTEVGSKIILALAYFDLFKYPLTVDEIIKYSKVPTEKRSVFISEVEKLLGQQIVFQHGPYFSLISNEQLEKRRENGAQNASALMLKAHKYSRLIHRFPFVRSVCISGSLSKGCVDEQGDIDYFIITEPERLWITRTLLIAFKKVFLLNNHKYFCVNYFIDTEHLDIPDKNIFTATELLTLLPMSGHAIYNELINKNNWAFAYLPNVTIEPKTGAEVKDTVIKKVLESALGGYLGGQLDTLLMKLTIKRWKTKFRNFNEEELDTAMRSRKYVSKHHPQHFQQVVLDRFKNNITQVEKKLNVILHG